MVPICNRSGAAVQFKESMAATSLTINPEVTANYFRYVLLCVLSGFHNPEWSRVVSRKNVSRIEGSHIDPERRVREALVPDRRAPPATSHVVEETNSRSADDLGHQRSSCPRAAAKRRNRPREGKKRHCHVWRRNARRKSLSYVRAQYESQNLELLVRSGDGHHHASRHHRAMRLRMGWLGRGARETAIGDHVTPCRRVGLLNLGRSACVTFPDINS